MKKTIITVFLALFIFVVQAQVKCHIKGELRDSTQGKSIMICRVDVDIRSSGDYITAKTDAQGHFNCDVKTDKMSMYKVFLHEQWMKGSWQSVSFLIEDGAIVKLLFDDNTWKVVGGGPEQSLKVQMDTEAERLYLKEMKSIQKEVETKLLPQMEGAQAQGKDIKEDSQLIKSYREHEAKYKTLYDEYQSWQRDYYVNHPMLYTLYEIADQLQYGRKTPLTDLYHTVYENFHPDNPIHNTIRTLEAANMLKPGKLYIDFEARKVTGEKVQVSSLYKGKVALIDLWASWCGPCRRHSIAMIPIYEKYKDQGFTVVAIAREDEISKMVKASEKDGYPWQSLIDLNDELSVWQKNGLSFAGGGMYLIDREGKILSKSSEPEILEPLIKKALNIE